MAAQFIKAMCTKTGRYFGLRIEEEGGIKRCTDFYDERPEQAKALASTVDVPNLETAGSLRACFRCGSRKVGGCRCAKQAFACDGLHDYYEAELSFQVVCLRYCFELEGIDGSRVFFSNCGFTAAIPEDHERHFDCPQTLREEERFQVPAWAANKVIYQIFPSRFATDLPVKDRVWYQTPITNKAALGGNLRGITEKLPYIRQLGVDVIYMTPIFRSDSCH